jgi:hypothetical protein
LMDLHARNVLIPHIEKEKGIDQIVEKRIDEVREKQLIDEIDRRRTREQVEPFYSIILLIILLESK